MMNAWNATGCFQTLAALALALALGARPPVLADEVVLDDFVADPDFADGAPLAWWDGQGTCCPAAIEVKPGEGILVRATGPFAGIVPTREVFSGDVTLELRARIVPGGELGRGPAALIHLDPFSPSGYLAAVRQDRSAILVRLDAGIEGANRYLPDVGFDPTAGDLRIELRSVGTVVEFRAWPEGGERPEAPLLEIEDEGRQRSGAVALDAGPNFPGACFRWARVTVACPPPEPETFRRGDCNDDGEVNISDAVCVLNWLFLGSRDPGCIAALNTNGDEDVDIADPVYSLWFSFLGGPPPVPPYPECGPGTLPADEETCETPQSNCPQ